MINRFKTILGVLPFLTLILSLSAFASAATPKNNPESHPVREIITHKHQMSDLTMTSHDGEGTVRVVRDGVRFSTNNSIAACFDVVLPDNVKSVTVAYQFLIEGDARLKILLDERQIHAQEITPAEAYYYETGSGLTPSPIAGKHTIRISFESLEGKKTDVTVKFIKFNQLIEPKLTS